jgi:hypothetical protein
MAFCREREAAFRARKVMEMVKGLPALWRERKAPKRPGSHSVPAANQAVPGPD